MVTSEAPTLAHVEMGPNVHVVTRQPHSYPFSIQAAEEPLSFPKGDQSGLMIQLTIS